MTTKQKFIDWGGLSLNIKDLYLGSTRAGATGTNVTGSGGVITAAGFSVASGATVTTAGTTVLRDRGDGINFTSEFTLTSFAVGTSGDNASLGIGAKLFTLPAGNAVVKRVMINLGLTGAVSITAQTPVVGLGTVIATGAVAVLSGTATFQSYFAGTAVADIAGTKLVKSLTPTTPEVLTAGVHDVFLNTAVAWADVTAAGAVTATGTVTVEWSKLS